MAVITPIMQNKSRAYAIGIVWFIASLFSSVFNDVLAKKIGSNLPMSEVTFFRFFFSTITLLPIMLYYGKSSFISQRPLVHFLRGMLLFIGINLWCEGLKIVPISAATTLSFITPLFTLILAKIFLHEVIGSWRWLATIFGFIGVSVVLNPTGDEFNVFSLILLFSSFMFAALDILNKKFVVKESMFSMLFYSALVTTILGMLPAYLAFKFPTLIEVLPIDFVWKSPAANELFWLFLLGISANFILFFILKAFSYVDASAIAPFRYLELILSALCGYVFFSEMPGKHILLGSMIIIPCSFCVVYFETKANNKQKVEDSKDSIKDSVRDNS